MVIDLDRAVRPEPGRLIEAPRPRVASEYPQRQLRVSKAGDEFDYAGHQCPADAPSPRIWHQVDSPDLASVVSRVLIT